MAIGTQDVRKQSAEWIVNRLKQLCTPSKCFEVHILKRSVLPDNFNISLATIAQLNLPETFVKSGPCTRCNEFITSSKPEHYKRHCNHCTGPKCDKKCKVCQKVFRSQRDYNLHFCKRNSADPNAIKYKLQKKTEGVESILNCLVSTMINRVHLKNYFFSLYNHIIFEEF